VDSTAGARGALLGVLGFCIGLPLVSAITTGAISIPHNDDWAFFRILFHLTETGELQLVGWNEMTFVGQLLWAYPVALLFESIAAVTSVNALIAGLGLWLTYVLGRRFVTNRWALLIAFTVGIYPGFAVNVTTFMTEPTAFAAQLGCLLLGISAISSRGRTRRGYLLLSLLVGLYGFSIREFALAAPIAVMIGVLASEVREKRLLSFSVVAGSAGAVAALGLYLWRQSLGGGTSHIFEPNLGQMVLIDLPQSYFTVSLALIPAMVFLGARRRWEMDLAKVAVAIVVIAIALLTVFVSAGDPTCCYTSNGSVIRGNLLMERGPLGSQVLPGQRPAMPAPLWLAISLAAVGAGVLIATRFVNASRWSSRDVKRISPELLVLWSFGAISLGSIVFRSSLGGPIFDRYLTPLILVGAIGLARSGSESEPRVTRTAGIVVAALGVTYLALISSGHSFDAARWRAAQQVVDSGIDADDVDGGFEWVGYHYEGTANESIPPRAILGVGPGYLDSFPRTGNCMLVSSSEALSGRFEAAGSVEYSTFFGLRTESLWIYRFPDACRAAGVP